MQFLSQSPPTIRKVPPRTLHGQLHKGFALRRDLRLESAYF